MSRRKSSSQRKTVLSLAQVGAAATSAPAQTPHARTKPLSAAASASPGTPVAPPPATPTYRSGLPLLHRHAAGIDVGSFSHWVCVGVDVEPREFPAHTDGLKALAAWLHKQQIATVALESTGIYWVAPAAGRAGDQPASLVL